ncbi:MAG TPA: PAS domain S-box protein, partial [Desulfopila sp.]|nr:PAS domain S-box protein [Desulfopila sp.]
MEKHLSASTRIYRIVLKYVILVSFWILLSDFVVDYLAAQGYAFNHIQTLKGIVFVLVTAIMLYSLLRQDFAAPEAAWRVLARNEKRYRTAFENTPHPLWEVDLSQLKAYVDDWSKTFRIDLLERVGYNPELREQCFSRIRVRNINEPVYKLFGSRYQDTSKPPCAKLFVDEDYSFLRKELEALIDCRQEFEVQQFVVPEGWKNEIALNIHWAVVPGHEETYDRVLISAVDITGLEALIKKLTTSESKFRCLVENTSEAVLVSDTETIFFGNSKAGELLGVATPELYKTGLSEFIHQEDRPAFLGTLKQCQADQQSGGHVCRIVDKNGGVRWADFKFSLTDWGGGSAILILVADITEKVVQENQLRQAKLLFEKVFNSLQEAVLVIDSHNRKILVCNGATEKIFGYRQEEIRGKSTRQLHVDDNAFARFAELSEPVLEKGKAFSTAYTMLSKDGREILTEITVTPVDDLTGWTHGVVSVIRDITEKKRSERALHESERKYRRLLEDANEGIVVLQNSNIVYVNQRMGHVLGYDREELLCTPFLNYIHTDEQQEVDKLYQMVLSGGAFPPDREIKAVASQDDLCWLRVNAVQVEWENEPAVMALVTNISEQKALQEKTEEMEAQIVQAQKMESIGTLAGGIAHDFNNILSALLGFTEIAMGETEPDTSLRSDLEEVYSAGMRAKELVKQILAFARQSDDEHQPLQISSIIKEVIRFLRSSIPSSIEIRADITSTSIIMANPIQVHQVVMNLCTNAVQSMKGEKGTVHVSVEDVVVEADDSLFPDLATGNYIKVEIADDGAGIAPENIDQIFDPYFTTKKI